MWTDDQWAAFASILQRGFAAKEPFTPADSSVYRLLLADVEPERAIEALKAIAAEGQEFRPKPGRIIERLRRDPSKPTFDEVLRLIYGPRGVLSARSAGPWKDQAGREAAHDRARLERARKFHPLLGSFVVRQTLDRLRTIPIDDPEYGELRRRDLRDAWDAHVEAFDGREVAAIAAGGEIRQGLRALDPLVALEGISRPPRELGTGEAA